MAPPPEPVNTMMGSIKVTFRDIKVCLRVFACVCVCEGACVGARASLFLSLSLGELGKGL